MKQLSDLNSLIIDWAEKRNLNDPIPQRLKLYEEIGETARAILKSDKKEVIDGIGDIYVVLCILFHQTNANMYYHLDAIPLYNDIENDENYHLLNGIAKHACNDSIDTLSCLMYLNALAHKNGFTLIECANAAWNEIKNREGKTINGTFIKD